MGLTSTLRPTARAVFGLRPGPTPPFLAPAIAWLRCKVLPQKAWSPNVSNRKVCLPCSTSVALAPTGRPFAPAAPFVAAEDGADADANREAARPPATTAARATMAA